VAPATAVPRGASLGAAFIGLPTEAGPWAGAAARTAAAGGPAVGARGCGCPAPPLSGCCMGRMEADSGIFAGACWNSDAACALPMGLGHSLLVSAEG
jgi:hypothetical protein